MAEGAGFEPAGLLHPLAFQTSTRSHPGRSFQAWRKRQESNLRLGQYEQLLSRQFGTPSTFASKFWRREGESNSHSRLLADRLAFETSGLAYVPTPPWSLRVESSHRIRLMKPAVCH